MKLLLVEDEPLIREVMAELLEDAGFDVTAACTGDEAVILLADDGFAILLTDVNMPGLVDGIGLAEHAREIHPGLPLVFVSGRPETERRASHLPGPKAFFPKPYDLDVLIKAVNRMALA